MEDKQIKSYVSYKNRVLLIFMGLFLGLCGCGDDSGMEDSFLEVSPKKVSFLKDEVLKKIKITSNMSWSIACNKAWCEVTPINGAGDQEITLQLVAEALENDLIAELTISTEKEEYRVEVVRESGSRQLAKVELLLPEDGATEVSVLPEFNWKPLVGAANDTLSYQVFYSLDKIDWKQCNLTKDFYYMLTTPLSVNTCYYWKIVASDGKGGRSESDVMSFTTSSVEAYQDGEKYQYQKHTKGNRGVRVVVLGDGFRPQHFEKNGVFDDAARRAVEGLFSAEPFKTYREYFDIYQIAAYSHEEGASIRRTGQEIVTRDTRFNVCFVDNPSMQIGDGKTGDSKVYDFVKMALNISEEALKETIIILISNMNQYGGACYMNLDKKTIAICANSTLDRDEATGVWRDLEHVVCHEAGGHAIGLLADEYSIEGNENKYIPDNVKNEVKEYFQASCYGNIDLTNDPQVVRWKHFIGRPGYEEVGFYEGSHDYGKGVWRAEKLTCMDNNAQYYSAPAREAIVRHIMQLAGEKFDMEAFYANDKVRAYPY